MNVNPTTQLALDPQLTLRNDVDRAVLFTRPQPLSKDKPPIFYFLHPREAILLALFDGDRTLTEVEALWTELTGRAPEDAAAEMHRALRRYTEGALAQYHILMEVDERNRPAVRRYDPLDFIIPDARVNLTDTRLRRPSTVCYLPTLCCPQRCVYCYAQVRSHLEKDLLPLGRLREIFSELAGIGVEVIQMSGGDPFARKDIFEILEAILEAGMVPDVPTKLGLSRTDAVRLREMGISLVQVSLDSVRPEIIDRMVGLPGYHTRVFRLLEDLRAAGLAVRVNSVLTPWNAPYVGELIDFLGRMGNVVRLGLTTYGRSRFCHSDELFLSPEEVTRIDEERGRGIARYPEMAIFLQSGPTPARDLDEKARRFKERSLCTANRHGFVLLPDGRVTACEQLYDHPAFLLGDLRVQSVMEMWSSPEALALLHPDQNQVPDGPCRTCAAFEQCNLGPGRCWRDVIKAYGADKPYYPDPLCPLAPEGLRLN